MLDSVEDLPRNPFVLGMLRGIKPRHRRTLSEWAEATMVLAPERSASPGPFRIGDASYQRGMLDCVTEPEIDTVIFMTSSQVGKTTILAAVQGYYSDEEPSPQLSAWPTQILADAYSIETFETLVRDSPDLRATFAVEAVNSKNTTRFKTFPGGYITFVGANIPAQLASRPIRVVTGDEIDRWPVSSGKEGSPLVLAKKRTTTFRNKKIIWSSTPVLELYSRITVEFESGDKRRYHIVCPSCETQQHLEWKNVHYVKGKERDARYACEGCGEMWNELTKRRLVREAENMGGGWIAEKKCEGTASFHINELYSPWSSMKTMAETWEASKNNPEKEQTFFNTSLGLPYKGDLARYADAAKLQERLESYPSDKVPQEAALITASVDVQDDRLEVMFCAWGMEEECWILDHAVIQEDPGLPSTWKALTELLLRKFIHPREGRIFQAEAVAIDSGGHFTQQVYRFASDQVKFGRRWYAIRGNGGEKKPIWELSKKQDKKTGVKLYLVGVDDAKMTIYKRYGILKYGPAYLHIPDRFDEAMLKQLTAERAEIEYEDGYPVRKWTKDRTQRNEMLDLMVYNYAVLSSLKVDVRTRLLTMYGQNKTVVLDAAKIGELYR